MIRDGIPFCDGCRCELERLPPEEADGWGDWRTAKKHYCDGCYEAICDEVGFPPCDECETHPCERGRDCWATPPLHIFPYETYFADVVGKKVYTDLPTKAYTDKNLRTFIIATPKDRPLTDYMEDSP